MPNSKCHIVTICGSPVEGGLTEQLLKHLEDTIKEEYPGINIDRVNVRDVYVEPCVSCMKCRNTGRCDNQHDDIRIIASLIDKADGIVVAAPTYWANIPGQLKMLFDRLVPTFIINSDMGRPPKGLQLGKPAAIMVTCTAPWPFNILGNQSNRAVQAIKSVLGTAGFKILRPLHYPGTRGDSTPSPKRLERAESLGLKIGQRAVKFHRKRKN